MVRTGLNGALHGAPPVVRAAVWTKCDTSCEHPPRERAGAYVCVRAFLGERPGYRHVGCATNVHTELAEVGGVSAWMMSVRARPTGAGPWEQHPGRACESLIEESGRTGSVQGEGMCTPTVTKLCVELIL